MMEYNKCHIHCMIARGKNIPKKNRNETYMKNRLKHLCHFQKLFQGMEKEPVPFSGNRPFFHLHHSFSRENSAAPAS